MGDFGESLGRVGYAELGPVLSACGREGFTGRLLVSGTPGGVFHLRDGLVVAAESPGAPGAVALLLRSGRLTGEQWAELVREAGGAPWPAAALTAHGHAGAAQLRVICVMALHDAAFAVAAGPVEDCERAPAGEPLAPVPVGEPPTRMLQDAARKLTALAALPHPVRPDRERPVPADGPPVPVTGLQRELLGRADGRRTARDLAFLTGRGVYAVTVEVARMLGDGLLCCPGTPAPIPVRVPERVPGVSRRRSAARPAPPPGPITVPDSLPRRTPGASGITEALTPERHGASWKGFFRLRNGSAR
ncbi:MarR family transcriptional regulator [Streptomyces tropicalis]|uniref:MarR family transcriptional regulator n=1 Tax=Streptomyces tropicalis TaxID=3034234 RepID=A0ABT6A0E9_9ACTN|nr:MarR family transcriptional regulator [Streptomyces tropicalis]MDF3298122.1 MarR family transcriptional regulator [Streptomyces tropicalis]